MMGIFSLGGGEIVLILMIFGILPLLLLLTAFWIWMLIDCINNNELTSNGKTGWILAIALTHWLGALIYFFAGRPKQFSKDLNL